MELTFLRRSQTTGGIGLFAIIRDELYFLPRFLAHYRKLGVTEFLIYDDRSVDGSTELLVAQPDCTVVTGPYNFSTAFGTTPFGLPKRLDDHAKEVLPDRFFNGRWALTVDADEFLLLPSAFANLDALISHLDTRNLFFAAGPMVDFYPERLSALRSLQTDEDPFSFAPYFDRGPLYDRMQDFPYVQKRLSGVRGRLLRMLLEKRPDALAGETPPVCQLFKVPLLKHGFGISRVGSHYVNAAPLGDWVALAHFKLYPRIRDKISRVLQEKQRDAPEYWWLHKAIEQFADVSLLCEETCRFCGSASLESARLIEPPPTFVEGSPSTPA
jgi:hypothetical protein